jgi:hypothetical protein
MAAAGIMGAGLFLAMALSGGEPRRDIAVDKPLAMPGDVMEMSPVPVPVPVPALGRWAEAHVRHDDLLLRGARSAAAPRADCLAALRDIAAGDVLRAGDFDLAACEAVRPARAFRYVASQRAVRAARPIGAGEVIPRFAGYGVTAAYAGDTMMLLAVSGPVAVAREVRALQSARDRERMLVRTPDGQVLSVPCGATAP